MSMALDWILQNGTSDVTICTDNQGTAQSHTSISSTGAHRT